MDFAIDKLPRTESVKEDSIILMTDGSTGQSFYITVEELYRDVWSCLKSQMSIGSMAYENKEDYALTHHDHDQYSTIAYQQSTFPIGYTTTANVAEICMGNTSISIRRPCYSEARNFYLYSIGEIKFSCTSIGNLDVTALDFDGWAKADGSVYNIDSFADYNRDVLKQCFPYYPNVDGHTDEHPDSTRIQVPDLQGKFFRPTIEGLNQDSRGLSVVPAQVGIPQHTHQIWIPPVDEHPQLDLQSSQCSIIAGTSAGITKDREIQAFVFKPKNGTITDTIQTKISWSNDYVLSVNELYNVAEQGGEYEQDTEPCPRHSSIPVLIYLGPNSQQK